MPSSSRSPALSVVAVLFAILAVSDMLKPFQLIGDQTGFVFFGKRLSGTPNAIAGPLFGLVLASYAVGIWRQRAWALPLGIAYAAYVVINLSLFNFRTPAPPDAGIGYRVFGIVYAVIAIGVSAGTVWLLSQRRAELA
jgi:hypothetical protein